MKDLLFIHIPRTAGRSISEGGVNVINLGHRFADDVITQGYYSFTFVRNPYDRFQSSYYFYKNIYKGVRSIGKEINKYNGFEDFTLNFDNFKYKDDMQFVPQYKFINDDLDYIGRFEYLESDWKNILHESGHEFKPLPHINNSDHLAWPLSYTNEMKKVVYNLFEQDFNEFKYHK